MTDVILRAVLYEIRSATQAILDEETWGDSWPAAIWLIRHVTHDATWYAIWSADI